MALAELTGDDNYLIGRICSLVPYGTSICHDTFFLSIPY